MKSTFFLMSFKVSSAQNIIIFLRKVLNLLGKPLPKFGGVLGNKGQVDGFVYCTTSNWGDSYFIPPLLVIWLQFYWLAKMNFLTFGMKVPSCNFKLKL